jgi:hypothetical protein
MCASTGCCMLGAATAGTAKARPIPLGKGIAAHRGHEGTQCPWQRAPAGTRGAGQERRRRGRTCRVPEVVEGHRLHLLQMVRGDLRRGGARGGAVVFRGWPRLCGVACAAGRSPPCLRWRPILKDCPQPLSQSSTRRVARRGAAEDKRGWCDCAVVCCAPRRTLPRAARATTSHRHRRHDASSAATCAGARL